MLARDTLRCTLVRRRASALGGNGELAVQQPLEDGDAPPDGDVDAPRLVCAMVGRGVLLDGKVRKVAVPCALEPTPQLHLRACMLDALKQSGPVDEAAFQLADVRMHTGYMQHSVHGGRKTPVMSLQCRDVWHGRARHDWVSVEVESDEGTQVAYAQLVALLSYKGEAFAYVRWLFNAARGQDHVVRIAPRYFKNMPLVQSLQIISTGSIVARAQINEDLQFQTKRKGEKRFYLHKHNKVCM
jgi:hypothetical protein